VTGHGWTIAAMHRRSLARFDFDAVLLPYNFFMAQSTRYRESFEEVLAICRERKRRGSGHQVDRARAVGDGRPDAHHVVPAARAQADIDQAVHWILGLPDVFLNTAGDLSLLPKVLDAASRFQRRPPGREDDGAPRLDPDDVAVRPPHLRVGRAPAPARAITSPRPSSARISARC